MSCDEMSLKELDYIQLKNILIELKESARRVYLYEDSMIEEYRSMAEYHKNEIVDTLLSLDL